MRRIAGGVAGWFAAVAPLLGVNIAGYAGVFDTETAVVAGAGALIGGILLGSVVTGLIAGRSQRSQSTGAATATLPAGLVAGGLYVVSLIAVVAVAIRLDAAPTVVAEHPLRITGAIVCLGAMLLGMSLLFGMLAGRRESQLAPRPQAAPHAETQLQTQQTRYGANPGQPTRSPYEDIDSYGNRDGDSGTGGRDNYRDNQGYRGYQGYQDYGDHSGSRSRDSRRDADGYNDRGRGRSHGGYDERQPAPQRSGVPSRPPARYPPGQTPRQSGRNTARDDTWRDDRR